MKNPTKQRNYGVAVSLLLLVLHSLTALHAATVSGVVNAYYQVASIGSGNVTLGAGTAGAAHTLATGDKAVLIEMTGASMGVYEMLTVSSVAGATVNFTSGPSRTYGSGVKQLVWVPNDTSVTVSADVTAAAWNGTVGGVVALSGGTLTLNANISASGVGFSGTYGPGTGSDGQNSDAYSSNSYASWTRSTGGGGGIIGGGGGGGGTPSNAPIGDWNNRNTAAATAATATTAGQGVSIGETAGGNGGAAGKVGNGGSGNLGIAISQDYPGAPGGGGGSYGGGGGTLGSVYSSAYTAGGGGGGSWAGGGLGGKGGTATGSGTPHPDGLAGAAALPNAITTADHYLHDGNARLMMGGAGGSAEGSLAGGNGGGVIILSFTTIVGNSRYIMANGAAGAMPGNGPRSGSGGGAGGQIYVGAYTMSDIMVTANGGRGGSAVPGFYHVGGAGGGGGGGGIWFAKTANGTNTGANAGDNSADSTLASVGTNVKWTVLGGAPVPEPFGTVTVAGTTYDFNTWIDKYNIAGAYSMTNGVTMGQALAATLGVAESAIAAVFPELFQPDNPKNAGYGALPGLGGTGLVSTTELPPQCATITFSPASLPDAVVGTAYNQTVTPSGGTSPYTFSLSSGESDCHGHRNPRFGGKRWCVQHRNQGPAVDRSAP